MTKFSQTCLFMLFILLCVFIEHSHGTANPGVTSSTKPTPTTPKPSVATTTSTTPLPTVEKRWKTLRSIVRRVGRWDDIVPRIQELKLRLEYDVGKLKDNFTKVEQALKKLSNNTINRSLDQKIENASKIMLENSDFVTRMTNYINELSQHWNATQNGTLLVIADLNKKVLQQNIIMSKLNESLHEMKKRIGETMTNLTSHNSWKKRIEKLENKFTTTKTTTTSTEPHGDGASGIPVSSSWLIWLGLAAYCVLK